MLCLGEALIKQANKGTKAINPARKFISPIAINTSSAAMAAAKFG